MIIYGVKTKLVLQAFCLNSPNEISHGVVDIDVAQGLGRVPVYRSLFSGGGHGPRVVGVAPRVQNLPDKPPGTDVITSAVVYHSPDQYDQNVMPPKQSAVLQQDSSVGEQETGPAQRGSVFCISRTPTRMGVFNHFFSSASLARTELMTINCRTELYTRIGGC